MPVSTAQRDYGFAHFPSSVGLAVDQARSMHNLDLEVLAIKAKDIGRGWVG